MAHTAGGRKRMLTYKGKTRRLVVWARELGMGEATLRARLRSGWALERVFTKPVQPLKTHGHGGRSARRHVYRAWAGLIQRCTNANYVQFKDYGGRGIKVCARWRKFENFLADMGEPRKSVV